MATTYSIATVGVRADNLITKLQQVQVPDSVQPSGTLTIMATATVGGMQNAMRLGQQMLCKNPDGSQSWYTFDAERSTPSNPILRPV
jgi:hypothetical protein